MGTLGARPIAGADEDFAVPLALPAVEFVNRHGPTIIKFRKSSSALVVAVVARRRLRPRRAGETGGVAPLNAALVGGGATNSTG